jgi:SEC-C motif domain protein
MATRSCPCGLPASYDECCGRLHRGLARAVTAERLMRSRYSAYAVKDAAYLLKSWHSSTRPAQLGFERGLRWEGLEVVAVTGGSAVHTEGTVEFVARFSQRGQSGEMREKSRFVREAGQWVYLDGQ